ncbi:MAG: hypothetical protein DAHOPDDO_00072 [Ignavibacteriaceae bacterium]|nr:hypothetical protein [Ignavibacteriaceae bacterium]
MSNELTEGKKLTTEMVKQFFKDNQLDKLIVLLPKVEKYQVSDSLFCSAYKKAGEYLIEEERFNESIIILNKVRVRDSKSKPVFKSFVKAVDLFFKQNVEEFSKNDLEEFKQAILPIINFHKVNFPEHQQIIDSTDHLFRRIDYRIEYVAKDVQESKVTFRVQQIKNALYSDDMTIEQVRQEAGRLLAPTLRRMYFERFGNEAEEKDGEEKKEKEKKVTDKKKKEKKKKE